MILEDDGLVFILSACGIEETLAKHAQQDTHGGRNRGRDRHAGPQWQLHMAGIILSAFSPDHNTR
jgi:hypothetical protein